eukprot:TRINITY_DN16591_c0_g1_i20.p1 TRINITY_DN16591_c0_g1~~TRINITY_DN16591_c0_g1_i20.p1  ORF type:complete len:407 (+),score=97.57 TRINITY_DN16591_c0_g1_i20:59-1222(+)
MESAQMDSDLNTSEVSQAKPRRRRQQEVDEETMRREDQKHFQDVIDAFSYYSTFARRKIQNSRDQFDSLAEDHKKLLPRTEERHAKWEVAVAANTHFINKMIEEDLFSHGGSPSGKRSSDFNMEKVVSTLRQLSREWGKDGEEERQNSIFRLVDELERVLPIDVQAPYSLRVLCPGSGLGRLPFEICKRGYICQGNEWSYFMLICGNFLLNKTQQAEQFTIYPFVHQNSNVRHLEDQFRMVKIPEVLTTQLPQGADFSYAAGDFIEIYTDNPNYWDAVVTCFFLDTANNVIEYIETIKYILKPGGRWINLGSSGINAEYGPLLYHYADMPGEQSIEISYEEVIDVVKQLGFVIEKQDTVPTFYTHNPQSLMHTLYHAEFFSAFKPID